MTTPAKLGLGVLSLGSATGIAYAGSRYFSNSKEAESAPQKTSVSSLIEKEYKYLLLDTKDGAGNADAAQWETNWNSYKKANQNNDKDFFELKGWTKESTPHLKDELRKKCVLLSKLEIQNKEDTLYDQVTSYCGRYVTVKDEAEKKGLAILVTDRVADGEDTIWASKEATTISDLKKLGINEASPKKDQIRAGCGNIKGKSKKDSDYSTVYAIYEKVCTKPKTSELG